MQYDKDDGFRDNTLLFKISNNSTNISNSGSPVNIATTTKSKQVFNMEPVSYNFVN